MIRAAISRWVKSLNPGERTLVVGRKGKDFSWWARQVEERYLYLRFPSLARFMFYKPSGKCSFGRLQEWIKHLFIIHCTNNHARIAAEAEFQKGSNTWWTIGTALGNLLTANILVSIYRFAVKAARYFRRYGKCSSDLPKLRGMPLNQFACFFVYLTCVVIGSSQRTRTAETERAGKHGRCILSYYPLYQAMTRDRLSTTLAFIDTNRGVIIEYAISGANTQAVHEQTQNCTYPYDQGLPYDCLYLIYFIAYN